MVNIQNWYSMIPDVTVNGDSMAMNEVTPDLITKIGLRRFVLDMVAQPAGAVWLHNTPKFLVKSEAAAIEQARSFETMYALLFGRILISFRPYNAYRKAFDLPVAATFEDVTKDKVVSDQLAQLYRTPEALELYVGMHAEDDILQQCFK